MKQSIGLTEELLRFIAVSPSPFHVVANFEKDLKRAGFQKLQEHESWKLAHGNKYYVTRNDSSILAFCIPETDPVNFQIIASHSDSPAFKVKEHPEIGVCGKYVTLNVEKYGGMLCAPWFDRPLSIAGRVMVRGVDTIRMKLVDFDRDLVMIPNLAIHMNREANEGYRYNAQKDMLPLLTMGEADGLLTGLLAKQLLVKPEDILSTDLFLYNRMYGSIWGAKEEFVSAPHLDDIQCAYASMCGLMDTDLLHGQNLSMCCVFDNEEVGSSTKQGADSTFLEDVIERICLSMKWDTEKKYRMLAQSFMLSADNAHAVHPNYPGKADPTNQPYLNEGIVLKYNANQKYTTDAVSAAVFKELCRKAGVPVQTYVNRSDIAGGSTLGNIANRHVSLNTADIGLPQLAMHSPYETAGVKDTFYLYQAACAFYRTTISTGVNGISLTRVEQEGLS